MSRLSKCCALLIALTCASALGCAQSLAAAQAPRAAARVQASVAPSARPGLAGILGYISTAWGRLTRSVASCETFRDVKSTGRPLLYLPSGFAETPALRDLEARCGVGVRHLPAPIEKPGAVDLAAIHGQGLLFLPHPYVVPGGRFNEMYGWDSYFILRGLLRAGKIKLARGIVENFFFEIARYGMVLNANRTYYLTRSQPPFLTSMILDVYDAEKAAGHDDRAWLEKAYPYAVRDYDLWVQAPHLAGKTGLSRYYALGNGPAPEVLDGNPSYYRYVAAYFLSHRDLAGDYLAAASALVPTSADSGPIFAVFVCRGGQAPAQSNCDRSESVRLTARYYKGDRSMRESGFDVSFRFGPFGAATPDYAPVGLNSLLYKTETDLERISRLLGRKQQAREWQRRAAARRRLIDKYLWNARRGLYFDYNVAEHKQSSYDFATTFYPLWAGAASAAQAKAVARNLARFLDPGGVVTSLRQSKGQWDSPYGWAPLQLIAAEGLRRYGFRQDADRIAYRFLGTVLRNFRRDGTIREKYNVVTRSSETDVKAGYRQNVIGFGWTNGVFLALLHNLPASWRERLAHGLSSAAHPRP